MAEKIEKCILCDTKNSGTLGIETIFFDCENCGEFKVDISEKPLLFRNTKFNKNRHLLSGVSYYNTVSQLSPLHVSSKNWEELIAAKKIPTQFKQKSDLLLNHMYDLAEGRPNVHIKKNIPFPAIYGKNSADLISHFSDLKSQYFITYEEITMPDGDSVMRGTPSLTIDGVKKIEELRETNLIGDNDSADDEAGNIMLTEAGTPMLTEAGTPMPVESMVSKVEQPSDNTENDSSKIPIPSSISIKESNTVPKLNIPTIAEVFARLIDNTKDGDNRGTFGVLGKWGRGKSYFIKYLTESLEESKEFDNIIIHFSAWQYQKTPEIWAYLYEKIAQKRFYGKFKLINIFLHNFYKNKCRFVFEIMWPLLWIIIVGVLKKNNVIGTDIILISAIAAPIIPIIYKGLKNGLSDINKIALKIVKKYTSRKSFEQVLGLQKEIQDELKSLLLSWIWEKKNKPEKEKQKRYKKQKKIILIVDDVDRCNPDNVLELLDTLRVVLDDPEISKRLKVIIAIDHLIVRDIMKKRFNDFFKNSKILNEDQYIRDYFDKLFLFSLHLAPLEKIEREHIISSIYETSNLNIKSPKKNGVPIISVSSGNSSKKVNVNRAGTPFVSTSEVQNKKIISEFQPMSDDELELFKESISKLDCTPRRIRILYYRYIFIKCLIDTLEKDDFTIGKSMEVIEKIASYEKKYGKANTGNSEEENNPKGIDKPKDIDKLKLLNWVLFD